MTATPIEVDVRGVKARIEKATVPELAGEYLIVREDDGRYLNCLACWGSGPVHWADCHDSPAAAQAFINKLNAEWEREKVADPGPQRGPASVGQVEAQVKQTRRELDNDFAELIKQAEANTRILQQPVASVYFSKDGKSLDVVLDNSKSSYGDWIKGEGGDICLNRDRETNRVVGAHLPLYAKTLVFGGDDFPTLTLDLENGKLINVVEQPARQPPHIKDIAEAYKDDLTEEEQDAVIEQRAASQPPQGEPQPRERPDHWGLWYHNGRPYWVFGKTCGMCQPIGDHGMPLAEIGVTETSQLVGGWIEHSPDLTRQLAEARQEVERLKKEARSEIDQVRHALGITYGESGDMTTAEYAALVRDQRNAARAEVERLKASRNFLTDAELARYYADTAALRQQFTAAQAAQKSAEERLLNLLAIIHRDGGQYTAEHGIDKSCADAHEIAAGMLQARESAERRASKAEAIIGDLDRRIGVKRFQELLSAEKQRDQLQAEADKLRSQVVHGPAELPDGKWEFAKFEPEGPLNVVGCPKVNVLSGYIAIRLPDEKAKGDA